ncbi:uncharacterized protein LOC142355538, partial [Convolutriloba macropyga]|uniref:uncharacterized protein LOC142355538 n=1 Tax=Convolutriloba macropyga TaxID=536237 RepID=UPI003F52790E
MPRLCATKCCLCNCTLVCYASKSGPAEVPILSGGGFIFGSDKHSDYLVTKQYNENPPVFTYNENVGRCVPVLTMDKESKADQMIYAYDCPTKKHEESEHIS